MKTKEPIIYIDGSTEMNEVNQGRRQQPASNPTPRAGLYYVIPSQIFEDSDLSHSEVLFYGLISGISHNDGYCYASDDYLAERMNREKRIVQDWLKKLEEHGYIKRETIKVGMVWKRKIYITHSFKNSKNVYETHKRATRIAQACDDRIAQACDIVSKEEEYINNTLPLSPSQKQKPDPEPIPTKEEEEEIEKLFNERPKGMPKIIHKKAWKSKVLKEMREESSKQKELKKTALKHKSEALTYDVQKVNGMYVVACKEYVELTQGQCCKIVRYDISDEEWYKQTGFKR